MPVSAAQLAQRLLLLAAAHQGQPPAAGQPGAGPQEQVEPLFGQQPAGVADMEGLGMGSGPDSLVSIFSLLVRSEDARVNAELRQDNDLSPVAFLRNNVAGLGVAGDGGGTGTIDAALEPAKGRGIAPQQVLPGEKERRCADRARGADTENCSQIVWLLIQMYNLWPQLPQLSHQSGIEVHVICAVE